LSGAAATPRDDVSATRTRGELLEVTGVAREISQALERRVLAHRGCLCEPDPCGSPAQNRAPSALPAQVFPRAGGCSWNQNRGPDRRGPAGRQQAVRPRFACTDRRVDCDELLAATSLVAANWPPDAETSGRGEWVPCNSIFSGKPPRSQG
jgi:hypothetical protein